ncbi:MAG: hypothetical protein RX316_05855 [bacterium]|nr:hypothetical protein [bacterium]
MIKIRKLKISGFRGSATIPFELDLTNRHRSIAIFGENGTGKSTITDAIEYLYTDKVDHLWKEDCYSEALRNLSIASDEDSLIEMVFSKPDLNNTKILTPTLKVSSSNSSDLFKAYIEQSKKERLFFRNRDLVEFIFIPKGKKRQKIAEIIGYEEITKFRDLIVKTYNSLTRDGTYRGLTSTIDAARGEFVQLVGRIIESEDELYKKATELVKGAGIEFEINDEESYGKCIEAIHGKLTTGEKAAKRQQLESFRDKLRDFKEKAVSLPSYSSFLEVYTELVKNRDKIKQLDLEGFLSRGKDLIEKEIVEPDKCPFCLSEVDYDDLLKEIQLRIVALAEIREEHTKTSADKENAVQELSSVILLYERLVQTKVNEEFFPDVFHRAKNLKDLAETVKEDITKKFDGFLEIEDKRKALEDKGREFSQLAEGEIKKADEDIKSLFETDEERLLFDADDKIKKIRENYYKLNRDVKLRDVYQEQISSIEKIRDEFIEVQNAALKNVLDLMSEDVSKYYLYLHPSEHEKVDNIRLEIVGDEGVEFKYSFHGHTTHPPLKYLSESHLNSLGLSLFLASVKLFNKENGFFILDDVVTSLDTSHRRRLVRLLQEEFADYQVILLTHERFWFDIIKKELQADGWLMNEVHWTFENGIELKKSIIDQKELIRKKMGMHLEVGNDLRSLLEQTLKEICYWMQIKVGFLYNEENERRMCGELISEIEGTVNKKNESIKGNPIFSRLRTSAFVTNIESHDAPPLVSEGDIQVVLDDIEAFESLFLCGDCNRYVSVELYDHAEKKAYCKCKKKLLDWKI